MANVKIEDAQPLGALGGSDRLAVAARRSGGGFITRHLNPTQIREFCLPSVVQAPIATAVLAYADLVTSLAQFSIEVGDNGNGIIVIGADLTTGTGSLLRDALTAIGVGDYIRLTPFSGGAFLPRRIRARVKDVVITEQSTYAQISYSVDSLVDTTTADDKTASFLAGREEVLTDGTTFTTSTAYDGDLGLTGGAIQTLLAGKADKADLTDFIANTAAIHPITPDGGVALTSAVNSAYFQIAQFQQIQNSLIFIEIQQPDGTDSVGSATLSGQRLIDLAPVVGAGDLITDAGSPVQVEINGEAYAVGKDAASNLYLARVTPRSTFGTVRAWQTTGSIGAAKPVVVNTERLIRVRELENGTEDAPPFSEVVGAPNTLPTTLLSNLVFGYGAEAIEDGGQTAGNQDAMALAITFNGNPATTFDEVEICVSATPEGFGTTLRYPLGQMFATPESGRYLTVSDGRGGTNVTTRKAMKFAITSTGNNYKMLVWQSKADSGVEVYLRCLNGVRYRA